MKYLLVIGDGMADNPVAELGNKTPLQVAGIPTIDRLAAHGQIGHVNNCPPSLPAGSETAILSIFGCDPEVYFTGRAPQEAAALHISLREGDTCYRSNIITLEEENPVYEEKKILSHSAGSITGEEALEVINILNADPEFADALQKAHMELPPAPTFRPLAVRRGQGLSSVRFFPPHDHLGEKCGPYLPVAAEEGEKAAKQAQMFYDLQKLAYRILSTHPLNERRKAAGKMPANAIWFWAEGTAVQLPSFEQRYGFSGAVVSAVPIVHGIGVLRGLEMVQVPGATGEIDTNFEGKMEAAWQKIQDMDFVCLHLEAPDECTHNGDLSGKVQSIEWLDSRMLKPLLDRMDAAGMEYRILLLSDHKTLTSTRGHDGDDVPFLLYDSRVDTACGSVYDEPSGEKGIFVPEGHRLLDMLMEKTDV